MYGSHLAQYPVLLESQFYVIPFKISHRRDTVICGFFLELKNNISFVLFALSTRFSTSNEWS